MCRATIRSRIRATVSACFFDRFTVFLRGEVLMFLCWDARLVFKRRTVEAGVIRFKFCSQDARLLNVRYVALC